MQQIIKSLFSIQAIKFGSFTLKSGVSSPIYLDLRLIVSYPHLLRSVSETIFAMVKKCEYDLICGVPYTALPIATAISLSHSIPMIMRRKEVKEYGTKKAIEGNFQAGQRVLIIEDLVTSGLSVLETVGPIEAEGLSVTDIAVLIDREQGGRESLKQKGYNLHAAFTLTQILETLEQEKSITADTKHKVLEYISS